MQLFDYSALRMARISAHITQSEAAKTVGVTPTTLSNWENGISDIPASKLNQLMELYQAEPQDFFIRKDERKIRDDQ